ncbi:MAG: serine hydrolase domain-containing protein [bacterium]|nr:serine hydrolase domain-containing protein [bacterium]
MAPALRRLVLAAGLLCASSSFAADPLQAALARFLAANPSAPGVVAWVCCPRLGPDWTGAAGFAARDGGEPLTAAHTFRIASNTKTYVAAAVLRLAEQGRLSLDDPLGPHLTPEERELLAGDGFDLGAITLRHVLSHTSGLDEHSGDPRYAEAIYADPQHVWTRAEQVRRCVEWRDPVGAPGERYRYSDTGYVLLGGIVERLTGRPLGVAVHELLGYERLGLRSTWWELDEPPPAGAGPRAHQYIGESDTRDWHPSLDLFGGGGLVCDVRDLGTFMRLLLKGRVLRDEASLSAMTGGGTADYRLGLMCVELDGRLAWGHQGFWNTFVFHVPSLDLTVAGCVLDHDAANGRVLAGELVATIAELVATRGDRTH